MSREQGQGKEKHFGEGNCGGEGYEGKQPSKCDLITVTFTEDPWGGCEHNRRAHPS